MDESKQVRPLPQLRYLQPAQYTSWLRKVDDPDWIHHRYRDAADNATANAIRELRDTHAELAALTAERETLRQEEATMRGAVQSLQGWRDDQKSRAETAEARLARLREAATAVCDDWDKFGDDGEQELYHTLRAALANATGEVKG